MALKWNRHNGNWLISASRDHFCKLFDVRNLKEEMQCFRGHKREACSKRSSLFRSMALLLCIFPFTETINTSVILSVRCLVTHCHSFFNLNKSVTRQKDRFVGCRTASILSFSLCVLALAWHPIHERLFSSGGSDGSIYFWHVG